MSFFCSSKKVSIGLDIEDDSVKIVKLKHTWQGPKLAGIGVAELPLGDRNSGEAGKGGISSAIERILTEEEIKGKRVISSISGPSVHIQLARLPSLSRGKLRQAVKWMIKENVPFDLKETGLDYFVLDRSQIMGLKNWRWWSHRPKIK